MKAYADSRDYQRTIDFAFFDGPRQLVYTGYNTIETVEIEDGEVIPTPSLSMGHDMAKEMFQSLWDMGFRPREYKDESDLVGALKNHISFAEEMARRKR